MPIAVPPRPDVARTVRPIPFAPQPCRLAQKYTQEKTRPRHSVAPPPSPVAPGAIVDARGSQAGTASAPAGSQWQTQWQALTPFRKTVQRYLRRHCVDVHLAEDLAQETFLRAACSRTRVEDLDRPCAWLLRIASNLVKDTAQRASRDQLMPATHACFTERAGCEPIPGDDVSHAYFSVGGRRMSSSELGALLRRVWCELPPRDRAVLGSYYFEGKTAREAAIPYGTAPSLVKVWLFRARRRLQGLLTDGVSVHA